MAADKTHDYTSDVDSSMSEDEWENEEVIEDVEQQHDEIFKAIADGVVNLEDDIQADKFFLDNQKWLQAQGRHSFTLVHKVVDNTQDSSFEGHKPLLKLLVDKVPEVFDVLDFDGETALYRAVKKQQRNFVEFVCDNLPDAADALGAPLGSSSDTCLHDAIKRNASFVEYLIGKCDKSTLRHQNDRGNTPLHIAVEYEKCTRAQVAVVESLLEKCESALFSRNNDKLSPYRYHQKTLNEPSTDGRGRESRAASKAWGLKSSHEKRGIVDKNARGRPQSKRNVSKEERDESAAKIRWMLKLHCMRSQKRDDVIDFLYGLYPNRQIEFDLMGRPNTNFSESSLKGLARHLDFEEILQYVALPRLSVEKDTSLDPKPKTRPERKGLTDFKLIFDWLRDKKVKRIIKVNVQDDREIAHSDEVIENALQSFDVEVWQWKKIDICIETIARAAPNVKEVFLYSSGNNAVLRGWADTRGLRTLKKLTKVNLFVKEGLETRERTRQNIEDFKDQLKHLPIEIVDYIEPSSASRHNTIHSEKGKEQGVSNRWLDTMDQFTLSIQGLPSPQEPIRVALIDDGIDATQTNLHRNIVKGVSYCARPGSSEWNSYYATGDHGTLMADLICRICPEAQLYVAKLDEYQAENGNRQITAASAAKAVKWAIENDVHIISMSWTIERTAQNEADISALESEIKKAVKRNILLFCTANDQGNQKDKSYPANCDSKKLFRIGAATASGEKWEWVGAGQTDFIFPGEKVLVQPRHGSLLTNCQAMSGSSIATALASGLAALILYLVEIDDHRNLMVMRDHDRMMEAFKTKASEPGNYILVWDLFKASPDGLLDEMLIVREVVNRLNLKQYA
ncbi:hypothetical protein GP486_004487 [Trichoglossum hirsutum]|uniref:Peptidase S8/S53 domain-containing protein n=1 Tax=Trichoglossum hirsutum TaxID=265104 RepID=A0A9P8LAZ2_9PEZI|nr:hypothetical protein GP486_004487 [Trichoglossum hirsutum]